MFRCSCVISPRIVLTMAQMSIFNLDFLVFDADA